MILLSCVWDENSLKEEMQKNIGEGQSWRKVHVYTYPNYISSLGINNLSEPKQVIDTYEELRYFNSNKKKSIRLNGVYSIDKRQNSSSKNLIKVSTDHVYQSIKYYRISGYEDISNDLYDNLVAIIKKEPYVDSFTDIEDTVKKGKKVDKEDRKKKILMLAPADVGEEVVKIVKAEKKKSVFDVILIGPLAPHTYYLSDNVMLVTNESSKVYDFFSDKNIISSSVISEMYQVFIRHQVFRPE